MKRLNFYPYYKEYLTSQLKTTTFRLHAPVQIQEGDEVMLSVGWNEDEANDIHPARITKVYRKRILDLIESDFDGESPDCKSPEASMLVLSCIYKTVLTQKNYVWIVKFIHIQNSMGR